MSKRKRKRGSSNSHGVQKRTKRRAQRCSDRGRELEEFFKKLLEKMQEECVISSFEKHPTNSPEDQSGKDFTVCKIVNGKCLVRSLGITTSHDSFKRARVRYPNVPQFHFPMETKPETMQKRVIELFDE